MDTPEPVDPRRIPREPRKYEFRFERNGGKTVELRWRITQQQFASALDLDFIWKRCESLVVGAARVPGMVPEDLLLVLCVHGAKHRWSRLMWICDIEQLIGASPRLDWELVRRRASQLGLWRVTGLGLLLATEFLDAAVPQELLAKIRRDATVLNLQRVLSRELFDPPKELGEPLYHVQIVERRRDRVWYRARCLFRAWRKIIPNDRDRAACKLPVHLDFLYYLFRPLRLIWEYAMKPLIGELHSRLGLKSR